MTMRSSRMIDYYKYQMTHDIKTFIFRPDY